MYSWVSQYSCVPWGRLCEWGTLLLHLRHQNFAKKIQIRSAWVITPFYLKLELLHIGLKLSEPVTSHRANTPGLSSVGRTLSHITNPNVRDQCTHYEHRDMNWRTQRPVVCRWSFPLSFTTGPRDVQDNAWKHCRATDLRDCYLHCCNRKPQAGFAIKTVSRESWKNCSDWQKHRSLIGGKIPIDRWVMCCVLAAVKWGNAWRRKRTWRSWSASFSRFWGSHSSWASSTTDPVWLKQFLLLQPSQSKVNPVGNESPYQALPSLCCSRAERGSNWSC